MYKRQVQANRALDRSEKLFKHIFANIPAGVEIYDKDGYLIDLNNKDLEIFGRGDRNDQNLRSAFRAGMWIRLVRHDLQRWPQLPERLSLIHIYETLGAYK